MVFIRIDLAVPQSAGIMATQRAFEATLIRLGSGNAGQKLRRGCWSGRGAGRGACFSSKAVTAAAPPAVKVAGDARRDEEVAPLPARSAAGVNMASRKPMDAYLNKV